MILDQSKRITKKALLEIPRRASGWDSTSGPYNWIWIVPTRHKHDSGYMFMALVGARATEVEASDPKVWQTEVECAGWCDDIEWHLPNAKRFGPNNGYALNIMRMDCEWPSGVVRAHVGQGYRIFVGADLSTIEVTIKEWPDDR